MIKRQTIKPKPKSIPGFADKRELRLATVDSPYRKGEAEEVVRNIRESSLTAMHARGQIDDAQLRAGEWVRAKSEVSQIGLRVSDPSRIIVDTSGIPDPLPDRASEASMALSLAARHLGAVGWPVIDMVCGAGYTIEGATKRLFRERLSRSRQAFVGQLLRESLDKLAIFLGYASPDKSKKPLDKHSG